MAAIGPWKIDPTANFMAQYTFLNFAAYCLNNQTDILPNVSIQLYPSHLVIVVSTNPTHTLLGINLGKKDKEKKEREVYV